MPRLTCAHNHSLSPIPVYRFLCDLQYRDATAGVRARLVGHVLGVGAFCLASGYDNIVLARERWKIDRKELEALEECGDAERDARFREFLHARGVATEVVIPDSDNELYLNLDDESLPQPAAGGDRPPQADRAGGVRFSPATPASCAPGDDMYTNEAIFAFHKIADYDTQKIHSGQPVALFQEYIRASKPPTRWRHAPCSLCCGELYEAKLIDDWFFIRYTDPDFHLRLRLLVARPEHYAAIFARIGSSVEPLVDNGAVVKVVCDTYVREIERYGAGTMEAVERLFGIDSRAVLELLDRVAEEPADRRETVRWQLALLLLDDAMTAFGRGPRRSCASFRTWPGISNRSSDSPRIPLPGRSTTNTVVTGRRSKRGLSVREPFTAYEPVLRRRRAELERVAAEILRIRTKMPLRLRPTELLGSIAHYDDEPLVPHGQRTVRTGGL